MKYLKLFLLPLLIFSCSENRNINQFEFALGKKNSETLTYLVGDFEDSFLKKEYPNLNTKNAYEQFLKDLRVDKEINWKNLSKESRAIFNKSELKLAIHCINDSVWIEKNLDSVSIPNPNKLIVIKSREKCLDYNGKINYSVSETQSWYRTQYKIDSLMDIEKRLVSSNNMGSYSNALRLIPNKSEFLKKYIDDRQSAGFFPYELFTMRFLSKNVDFNDYFIKRLIITDLVY